MRKAYDALVVGAGVAGIHAALDLAETGQKVLLTDERPNIGGLLTQLDHQFPSDHCGMCKMLPLTERDTSSQFCLRKGLFHRNIDLALMSELTRLEGDPGQFKATLRVRSTFVDSKKCIGCGLCSEVCPVRVPSEFNAGLTERSAIHLPVPHNIPNHYTVDLENCERCLECVGACPTGAIDFQLQNRKDFKTLVATPYQPQGKRIKSWFTKSRFPTQLAETAEEAVAVLSANDTDLLLISRDFEYDDLKRVVDRGREQRPSLAVAFLEPDMEKGPRPGTNGTGGLKDLGPIETAPPPLEKHALCNWLEKRFIRISTDDYHEMDVGAVILAAGFDLYDPAESQCFAMYGTHPGIVTSLEFERMLSASGPGTPLDKTVRDKDGKAVRKIAWLQCVGSRDIKIGADFCSSICCMISIKEALLAKRAARAAGQDLEATIFYMDMRTCGKDFQRYRDDAQEKEGVRFIRSRLHSIEPDPELSGGLIARYVSEDGEFLSEVFDMIVLAVGARPPRHMDRLTAVTGIETNEWGFCKTKPYAPSRTSRLGVMAAGAFAGPRDIADSMIVSGAAALEASRLINIYAPLKKKEPEPVPVYRDTSREAPRTLAVLCTSCPLLKQSVDYKALERDIGGIQSVDKVVGVSRCCTHAGWEELKARVEESRPNRVLIGACMPYAYVPKLVELGRKVELNPNLMHVVDIYSELMGKPVSDTEEEQKPDPSVARRINSVISMGVAKLANQDPSPLPPAVSVFREALVIGGGVAGMTAALGIADHGYGVCLVEKGENLGGLARDIHYTLEDDDPRGFLENLVESVQNHPHIRVFRNTEVTLSTGRVGRFMSLLSTDEGTYPFEHGVTVLATGGRESNVYHFGLSSQKNVINQRQLEQKLATGELDLAEVNGVAMIQCWRSREENRNYCSKVCCPQALKNMLLLKKRRPDLPVYVFYRDIMAPGFLEKYYTQAREAGVLFFQYDKDEKPHVYFEDGKPVIVGTDPILKRPVHVNADMLVLSVGLVPSDTTEIAEAFGVPADRNGFYQEAESKWRPVDFMKQGVFMCGVARAPGGLDDAVASAKAAAQRALRILSEKRLVSSNCVAEVRHSLCALCGACISVCPFEARKLDFAHDRVVVNEHLCQGCGACAAVCPNSASYLRGFSDKQVMTMIDAGLAHGLEEQSQPTEETQGEVAHE